MQSSKIKRFIPTKGKNKGSEPDIKNTKTMTKQKQDYSIEQKAKL